MLAVRSADHLIYADAEAAAPTRGSRGRRNAAADRVVLPEAGALCARPHADRSGVPVALATRRQSGRRVLAVDAVCNDSRLLRMGLTFEEALVGATISAAYALDRHDRVGSLEVGKQMDARHRRADRRSI